MNSRRVAELISDPGKPAAPVLIGRVIRSEIRGIGRKLSRQLGFSKLYAALPDDWAIPDSDFARQAINLAVSTNTNIMLRHCYRSYCFGALLAARNNLKLDKEIFFVAAMLHDLGLTDKHADDEGSFEWVGAKLAHQFCTQAEKEDYLAAVVHNSIALHTSVGLADQYQPEIAMLHFGTSMDLFGMRKEEIPTGFFQKILQDYPRAGFKPEISSCLHHQSNTKPQCQFTGAAGFGVIEKVKDEL